MTSKSTLTDVSGCIRYAGQIDSNRDWHGKGKVFGHGWFQEGIFKEDNLFDGKKWWLNDDGSYDYSQVTQGEDKLVGKVAKLPGCQK